MNPGKAVGPDGVSCRLWAASGSVGAGLVSGLYFHIWRDGEVPAAWKGGRLALLPKPKGDQSECDSHRGLLVADHVCKHFTGSIAPDVCVKINRSLPHEQCGGTEGKGADRVAHSSTLFLEYARKARKSAAIVFVDLSKAFDRVVREVVMRLNSDCAVEDTLRSLGLSTDDVAYLAEYLRSQGTLFESLQIDVQLVVCPGPSQGTSGVR
eukprot:14459250-Alexandrium_andersonii.AAC.1